jgi:hypothetical protein
MRTKAALESHALRTSGAKASVASFRNRVVHHLLMNILEPVFERRMHPDSYACCKGKETHATADRLQSLMHHNT